MLTPRAADWADSKQKLKTINTSISYLAFFHTWQIKQLLIQPVTVIAVDIMWLDF